MERLKHTEGPWTADLRSGCCAVYPENRKDETAGCHFSDDRNIYFSSKGAEYDIEKRFWKMDEEDQANARLIAAAPEMLDALVNEYRMICVNSGCPTTAGCRGNPRGKCGERMREVIEKATGRKINAVLKAQRGTTPSADPNGV